MRRKKHTTEQIIRKLREAEQMRAAGRTVGEICPALEISEQSKYPGEGIFTCFAGS